MESVSSKSNKFYYIEGNIGSGKTTLCRMLGENVENCEIIYEPVDQWIRMKDNDSGKDILKSFYEDKQRWSYALQTYTFLTRIKEMLKPQEKEIRFIERSIYTDKNVFAQSLFDVKNMSSLEWNMYNSWFEWQERETYDKIGEPSGLIYIQSDPTVSHERMKKRNRNAESCVPLDYLELIHSYHENWLINEKKYPVLIINVCNDFENNPEFFNEIKNRIMEFIDNN